MFVQDQDVGFELLDRGPNASDVLDLAGHLEVLGLLEGGPDADADERLSKGDQTLVMAP